MEPPPRAFSLGRDERRRTVCSGFLILCKTSLRITSFRTTPQPTHHSFQTFECWDLVQGVEVYSAWGGWRENPPRCSGRRQLRLARLVERYESRVKICQNVFPTAGPWRARCPSRLCPQTGVGSLDLQRARCLTYLVPQYRQTLGYFWGDYGTPHHKRTASSGAKPIQPSKQLRPTLVVCS